MMLVVVAYDVSTESEEGVTAAAARGAGVRGQWAAGAEFGVRVPGGCGAVGAAAGRLVEEIRRGGGQPAVLFSGG